MTANESPEGTRERFPFPRSGLSEIEVVLEAVGRHTAEKATEIARLRRLVGDLYGTGIAACAGQMADLFAAGGRLFTFGDGGSGAGAQEAAAAFSCPPRGRCLPAICLTSDVAMITALSDDVSLEGVFARQIAALGRAGDIALGLSACGGSANVVRAFEEAARRGMLTIALAGGQGGRLAELDVLDHLFVIPSSSVHRVQEAQATVHHVLWELAQQALGALPSIENVPAVPDAGPAGVAPGGGRHVTTSP